MLQLVHRTKDVSSTSDTTGSGSMGMMSAPTTTSAVNTEATQVPEEGSLSAGAQAGIGVGAYVAGLAAISAAVFFWMRRKKRAPVEVTEEPKPPGHEHHPVELAGLGPVRSELA